MNIVLLVPLVSHNIHPEHPHHVCGPATHCVHCEGTVRVCTVSLRAQRAVQMRVYMQRVKHVSDVLFVGEVAWEQRDFPLEHDPRHLLITFSSFPTPTTIPRPPSHVEVAHRQHV